MAVFWFGLGKKLKNAFTKKEADGLYLPKSSETDINELKRLTQLNSFTDSYVRNSNGTFFFNVSSPKPDLTRPIYYSFKKLNGNNTVLGEYNFVVFLAPGGAFCTLTEDIKVRLQNNITNKYTFEFQVSNLSNNNKIKELTMRWTGMSLVNTISDEPVEVSETVKNN